MGLLWAFLRLGLMVRCFLMVLHGLHGTYGELTDRTEDLTSKHWDVRDTSINNTNYEIWIDLLHK